MNQSLPCSHEGQIDLNRKRPGSVIVLLEQGDGEERSRQDQLDKGRDGGISEDKGVRYKMIGTVATYIDQKASDRIC